MGPITLTSDGWPYPYFSGTAIKTRISRDKPSRKAHSLKRPIDEVNNIFIIKTFVDKVFLRAAKMARELRSK